MPTGKKKEISQIVQAEIFSMFKLPIRVLESETSSDFFVQVTTPTGIKNIQSRTKDLMEKKSGLFSHSERYEMRDKTVTEISQEIWQIEDDAKDFLLAEWFKTNPQ